MDILSQKAGEVKVWHLLVAFALVLAVGFVVKNMLTYDNIVVSANNGSFLKKSFFSPLTGEAKGKLGADLDKSVAASAAKA